MSQTQTTIIAPVATSNVNQVDGQYTVLPGQTPQGEYILSVLLKRTYEIASDQICRRSSEDEPLVSGDLPWGDPVNTTIQFESDFVPYKLQTDIIVNGTAHAPGGTPVETCDVSIRLEQVTKTLRIIGDRKAHYASGASPVFSDPQAFTTMPLRYEYAYGGIDVYSDVNFKYPCPYNLMGKGFVVNNSAESLEHVHLPNIEDPDFLLTPENLCLEDYQQWEKQPFPAGICCYPKTWWARAQLIGVMPADREFEQEMRKQYAQLVPKDQREAYEENGFDDMDFRFFNAASKGLSVPYLKGGERVHTNNLGPEGKLRFKLPDDSPSITLDIGDGDQQTDVVMHTVFLRMEEKKMDITWRAAFAYPGPEWLPQLTRMKVTAL